MEPYWNQIKQIVKESDVVLEILDARAVEMSQNEQLERIIAEAGRPRIFVINKADLATREELERATDKISKSRNVEKDYVVHFTNKNRRTAKNLLGRIRQVFAKHGKRQSFIPGIKRPYREAKGDIIVGVVGYPNVGKSSVINAIAFKKKAPVSSKAGTTHGIHWINAGHEIKLIDTPGVIPLSFQEESRLGIIAARNPERIKDPETVACRIIEMFVKEGKLWKIENHFHFKIKEENLDNVCSILEQLSIEKKHLKKGGVPDEKRTAMTFIREWQTGRLKL